jgi:hypothetical protein
MQEGLESYLKALYSSPSVSREIFCKNLIYDFINFGAHRIHSDARLVKVLLTHRER